VQVVALITEVQITLLMKSALRKKRKRRTVRGKLEVNQKILLRDRKRLQQILSKRQKEVMRRREAKKRLLTRKVRQTQKSLLITRVMRALLLRLKKSLSRLKRRVRKK